MFNRREFSTTLALASASGLVRPRATFGIGQQSTVFDWRPIRDAMRVAFGAGGNVLAVNDGSSLVLVDTKNAGFGEVLRAEAESFGGTLESVVNTHHHGDHIGGNPFFTGGVPVYGQERGVARAMGGALKCWPVFFATMSDASSALISRWTTWISLAKRAVLDRNRWRPSWLWLKNK
ncbi:MAG TPA: MBL fold metallo-hydrolase [Acidobacteriota bacterium]|nr:MBL fold metallo-hydrolase [Acidobacteriota bacterium]